MGGNFVNLLVFVLVVGAPLLSWIAGKIKEAHELKRLRDVARKNYEEQLRTGRAPEQPAPSKKEPAKPTRTAADLQALAERRQQQLRELRQRQIGQAAPAAPVKPTQRPAQRLPGVARPAGSGGPTPRPNAGGQRPLRQSAPIARQTQRGADRSRRESTTRAVTPTPPGARAVQSVLAQAMAQKAVPAAPPPRGVTPTPVGVRPVVPTREDLRRAIVLSELLDRPVSLRDEA
ncbi:MAG: hypothetical protein KDA20_04440 [Phycisphaerales bacterium]|nr:hypothetical protein [Phycisphaerales bacterium]